MKKSRFKFLYIIAAMLIFVNLASIADQEEWNVPPAAAKMKNPTDPNDADNKMVGKNLFMQHCKSCHGKEGKGDGPKAAELDTPTGDFSTAKFQGQSDGSLFFKTKEGRDEMPGFGKKIPNDEDIWLIVNYLRTLKG